VSVSKLSPATRCLAGPLLNLCVHLNEIYLRCDTSSASALVTGLTSTTLLEGQGLLVAAIWYWYYYESIANINI
jgi:hypothetical protein